MVPLIHSGLLAPFVTRAAAEGEWCLDELLKSGLPPSLASGEPLIVPLSSALDFVHKSAKRLQAPELGLEVGALASVRSLPHFDGLLARSMTLRNAISIVALSLPKLTNVRRIWLNNGSRMAQLCQATPRFSCAGSEYAEQFALMLLINLVREVGGRNWSPKEVTVSPSTFELIGRHPELLRNSKVNVGDCTSFAFDSAMLDRPLQVNRKAHSLLVLPRNRSQEVPLDLIGSITACLESNVRAGHVGLRFLSVQMGVSARTVQRELAVLGLTYDQLLGRARLRIAHELLKDRKLLIEEIAFELGYQDAANFTRAFKRWTGLAPREYRTALISPNNDRDHGP